MRYAFGPRLGNWRGLRWVVGHGALWQSLGREKELPLGLVKIKAGTIEHRLIRGAKSLPHHA
jgi:hypothetical protein